MTASDRGRRVTRARPTPAPTALLAGLTPEQAAGRPPRRRARC